MARPKKTGLDYFPKDTGVFGDRKIRRLLKMFGAKGYLINDYLLCLIYSENGYWVEWDDDLAFDIADALGDGITENLVCEVLNTSIKIGLFSVSKYNELNILTSIGIQKRYIAAKRGKAVIDAKIGVYETETKVIAAKTPINVTVSTQSKVKESKVKESKKSKPKKEIPELEEFLNHCKKKIPDKYEALKFSIEAKYKSWVASGWKDGNGKPIKNWKLKIDNVIPYLKPFYPKNQLTIINPSDDIPVG